MPPPIYYLGITITTKVLVPARVCRLRNKGWPWLDFSRGRGYQKVSLPIGRYETREIWRDIRYYHDYEHSDGYTYRLDAQDRSNPLYGKRISVWQNDLVNAIVGLDEDEIYE